MSVTRPLEPLTARELDVLCLLCEGASNRDISRRLGVGQPTVKFHVAHILAKLGVQRRTQAVVLAIHLRLVHPWWLDAATSEHGDRRSLRPRRDRIAGGACDGGVPAEVRARAALRR